MSTSVDAGVTAASPTAAETVDLLASGRLRGLAAAFLAGRDLDLLAPAHFLAPGALPSAAPALDPASVAVRAELANAVAATNVSYGHPTAWQLAAKLADPACRVVVTGQQPGLLGGPLYALVKAVAAVRLCEQLEATGVPAVAVYWVATEDHDWAEATQVVVPTAANNAWPGGLARLDLGPDNEPLVPLGMRTFGPQLAPLLASLATAVPGERYGQWLGELAAFTRPDARFGEAFSRLLVRLLAERCPLLLDALHPALKLAERPHLERLVERRAELAALQTAADTAIEARGFPLQVSPQPGASPLFLLADGARRRILWRQDGNQDGNQDGFVLRGREEAGIRPLAELREILADNPSIVSPGVLARPAIQDAVLGTSILVLGPGELAYLPQVAPTYRVLAATAPAVALRPQALVLEAHQRGHLAELAQELGLTLAEILDPAVDLARRVLAGSGGDFVTPARAAIRQRLSELSPAAAALDPTLERALDKTIDTVERALDAFAGRVAAAAARRGETRVGRAERLREVCLPSGVLQERVVTTAHFSGKYGESFVAALFEQLGDDPTKLALITPAVPAATPAAAEGALGAPPPNVARHVDERAPVAGGDVES